jgi:hypothetical protein
MEPLQAEAPSPDTGCSVGIKQGIDADEGHRFDQALRSQHPIKWIPMMKW